jgi:hypothetical protein
MIYKKSSPSWWKKFLELGSPKPNYSGGKSRAYRTVAYRYFWAFIALFVYFALCAYLLGGDDSGSSGNSGIGILIAGAIIFACMGAFFAPALNRSIERMMPSGRRKKQEMIERGSRESRRSSESRGSSESSSRSSGSGRRSRSQSSSAKAQSDKADS